MKTTLITCGLIVLGLWGSPARALEKPKPSTTLDAADLIGSYVMISGEKYGEKEPEERLKGTTVRITEDRIVVSDKTKQEVYVSTYTLESSSNPTSIVLTSKRDSTAGHVAKGLIRKDGDTIRLIYALPDGQEPTEFRTKEKQLMFVMQRQPQKEGKE